MKILVKIIGCLLFAGVTITFFVKKAFEGSDVFWVMVAAIAVIWLMVFIFRREQIKIKHPPSD